MITKFTDKDKQQYTLPLPTSFIPSKQDCSKTNKEVQTLAKAFDYVLQIGKVPIVVNDSVGFYTSRVFEKYTCEGMGLVAEGNPAESIEMAGVKAGFPVGPLAVVDEINIGLAANIRNQ